MSDIEITKIIFGIFLSLGSAVLFFLSFKLYYRYLVQKKRCTEKTTGTVKRYSFLNRNGIYLPIVSYSVGGKNYKVTGPEYKAYKIISKSTPLSENETGISEEKQVLTINRTSNYFVGFHRNPIAKLYPKNSEIEVYYDPENPKLSYVLRYCNKKWCFWLMFFAGIFTLAMDFFILFVL